MLIIIYIGLGGLSYIKSGPKGKAVYFRLGEL